MRLDMIFVYLFRGLTPTSVVCHRDAVQYDFLCICSVGCHPRLWYVTAMRFDMIFVYLFRGLTPTSVECHRDAVRYDFCVFVPWVDTHVCGMSPRCGSI